MVHYTAQQLNILNVYLYYLCTKALTVKTLSYMKLKKYGKGGKYKMYQDGGPVKAKKMSKEEREKELTKMADVAQTRLAEMEGEKAYLAKRKIADREYRIAIKEGATPEQATKIAEKYMSMGGKMYIKGGQVKLDANKDGKISGADFKMLKAKKK